MLSNISLKLNTKNRYTYSTASIFQSVLMERIDKNYAKYLHEDGLHPYSQYIVMKDDDVFWNINTLNSEALDKIIPAMMDLKFNDIYIEKKDETVLIDSRNYTRMSYSELIDKYLFADNPRYINIRFKTPCSFKVDGNYAIYPTIRHIFQSLMQKYDAFSVKSCIFSEETLDDLEKYIEIKSYNMRSTIFNVGKVKIPSFIGDMCIRVNGPDQLASIVWILLEFAEYSGVGIKTGMGMGAVELIRR